MTEQTTARKVHTFDEARAHLRVSRSTMFRLINDGQLHPFKIGRALRFTDEDLDRFISERLSDR